MHAVDKQAATWYKILPSQQQPLVLMWFYFYIEMYAYTFLFDPSIWVKGYNGQNKHVAIMGQCHIGSYADHF